MASPLFSISQSMQFGPTDLLLPIIANFLLILIIILVNALPEQTEFISGISCSQANAEAKWLFKEFAFHIGSDI
jgi:hypothetical protein